MEHFTFVGKGGDVVLAVKGVGGREIAYTKFFNQDDITWLEQGGEPKLNADGYMIMPYGHSSGEDVYPELFQSEEEKAEQANSILDAF